MRNEKKSGEAKRAIIYARQSSGADDVSASVDAQIENCRKLAEKNGFQVLGVFSDLNTSGKTYPVGAETIAANDEAFTDWYNQQTKNKKFRAGLGAVIELLPMADYLVVDDITRLYRPCRGSFLGNYVDNILRRENVQIVQVKGEKIDLAQFDASLINMLKQAINDEQIANCKKKSIQAFAVLRNKGIFPNGGGKAWGTRYNVADKTIEIMPEYIEVIKGVFASIIDRKPYNQIMKEMQKQTQTKVYNSTLYHVAENPIYAGYMRNDEGEIIPNTQIKNPCITFETWQAVQNIMAANKRQPNKAKFRFLPFSGLLYCGYCGARLVSGSEKGRTFYYCKDGVNIRESKECAGARVMTNTEEVEDLADLTNAIKPLLVMSIIADMKAREEEEKTRRDLEKIRVDLANLKAKQVKINEMFIKGLIDENTLETSLAGVKKQIAELQGVIIRFGYTADEATKHLQAVNLKQQAEKFMTGELSDADFAKALKKTVSRIECFREYIRVYTAFGTFNLDRVKGKRRMFPRANVRISGKLERDFAFEVTYASRKGQTLLEADKIKVAC